MRMKKNVAKMNKRERMRTAHEEDPRMSHAAMPSSPSLPFVPLSISQRGSSFSLWKGVANLQPGSLHFNIKFRVADLQNHIQTHYTAPQMVIAAYGAVKHEDFVEQVKKLFTKLSMNPISASQLVENEPTFFIGSEVRMLDDDIPLAQFAIAFEGASWKDPDSIALMVMQAVKSKGAELFLIGQFTIVI